MLTPVSCWIHHHRPFGFTSRNTKSLLGGSMRSNAQIPERISCSNLLQRGRYSFFSKLSYRLQSWSVLSLSWEWISVVQIVSPIMVTLNSVFLGIYSWNMHGAHIRSFALLTYLWLVIEYNESIQPSPNLKREGVDWSQSKVIFITRVYK